MKANSKTALIFGAGGQDGYYLGRLLTRQGYRVVGAGRRAPGEADANGAAAGHIQYQICDVRQKKSVQGLVKEIRPDEVYNLAYFLSVAWGEQDEQQAHEVNVEGNQNVLDALSAECPSARFFHASSSYIFKPGPEPKSEDSPIAPANPYAQTKWEAHQAVMKARTQGLFACNGILFNHESPRVQERFVIQKVAKAAAGFARKTRTEPLKMGALSPVRDWSYAGDVAEAMRLVLRADRPSDFVVASGVGHRVREVCDTAFSHVGLDFKKCVTSEASLMRAHEVDVMVGNPARIQKELGWKPKVDFRHLVEMMVDAQMNEEREHA